MADRHTEVLRCPLTAAPLRPASATELRDVQAAAEALRGRGLPNGPLLAALVCSAAGVAYPLIDGIPCLLAAWAVPLGGGERSEEHALEASDDIKDSLRRFYDDFGWKQQDGVFKDAQLYEDLRAVSERYRHRANERVAERLPASGHYLLDVASGPIQYDDYAAFSERFEVRLCVDLSIAALRQARERLGDRGVYILGDITNLPIADSAMDAFVSLHTIYHVPAAEQRRAFLELHRVLRPGGRGVVVYSWGDTAAIRVAEAPIRAAKAALAPWRGMVEQKRATGDAVPPLYFAPYAYRWFAEQHWPFAYRIASWRSLSVRMLKRYVPDSHVGERVLKAVAALEDRFPAELGRLGQYPLIEISK